MKGLIHVGANDGREYMGTERQVLLFEPLEEAFDRAVEMHKDNENVAIVNLAMGDNEGFQLISMNVASNNQESSSMLSPRKHLEIFPNIKFIGVETVSMTSLDYFLRENNLQRQYDEMVIDVQGYEIHVLRGAKKTLNDIKKITCEVNRAEVYEGCTKIEEVDEFLAKYGFKQESVEWFGDWGNAVYVK